MLGLSCFQNRASGDIIRTTCDRAALLADLNRSVSPHLIVVMSEERIMLADKLGSALLSQAAREGLARLDSETNSSLRRYGPGITQDALSLLLLADELILPRPIGNTSDIPFLTDSGIMKIYDYDLVRPTQSGMDPLGEALKDYECIRPFVLSSVLAMQASDREWDAKYASSLGLSRKRFYDFLIQYGAAFYANDRDRSSLALASVLPPRGLQVIDSVLEKRTYDNPIMHVIMAALFSTLQFTALLDLSVKLNASLASGDYGRIGRGWFKTAPVTSAEGQTRGLSILRTAIRDSGRQFPAIDGIRHAVELRQDPYLKSLRRYLRGFQAVLAKGDAAPAREAAQDVAAAQAALRRARGWGKSLRWVHYAALPIEVADHLFGGTGLSGIVLALYSVVGTFAKDWSHRHHGWLLFGLSSSA